jgi:hypothetical protein
MLAAMTRRYYKIRELRDFRTGELDGRPCATVDFALNGVWLHLVSAVADAPRLDAVLAAVAQRAGELPDPEHLVTDLFLTWPDRPESSDEAAALLQQSIEAHPLVAGGRRITVTVVRPQDRSVEQFTFRPDPTPGTPERTAVAEERIVRGLHPLIAQRLDLWRLKNFVGTRLPAPDDVYLIHCVAPNNPADERLVALAAVRDVQPLRDAAGQVIAFPAAERVLAACLDGIRRVQASRGNTQRLDANRVFLHVWPVLELPLRDLTGFARNSAPLSVGAGLEEITVLARLRERPGQEPRPVALRFANAPGRGVAVSVTEQPTEPIAPRDDYTQKVQRSAAAPSTPTRSSRCSPGTAAASWSTTSGRRTASSTRDPAARSSTARSTGSAAATPPGWSPVW